MFKPHAKTALATAVLAASSHYAIAEEAEVSSVISLEEVIVTAQKREQNMQDTPIAIVAYDEQAIEDQGIYDISDVGFTTPNVQVAESPGGSTGATIAMRGSVTVNPAVTWEPTVGVYMDGVFIAKNVGGLFDVAQLAGVELLRGPQGTLYGKNTVGGAINLITRKPGEELGGTLAVGVGNYDYRESSFSIDTGKLGDLVSLNFAFNKRDRDGFYTNDSTADGAVGEFKALDSSAARVAALFDVSDDLEIFYTYDWSEKDNTPALGQAEFAVTDGPDIVGVEDVEREDSAALDGAKFDTSDTEGHALTITWDVSDELTFKSITAKRKMHFDDSNDYDGFDLVGFHTERHVDHEQTSQEFQFIGDTEEVKYVAGLFYFNEKAEAYNPFDLDFAIINNQYAVESDSYAAFGQAEWFITEALSMTAGARYTEEEKQSVVSHPDGVIGAAYTDAEGKEKWTNFSPMLVFSYAWMDDVTTYIKYSEGWKSGGFNGEAATAELAATPYDEEIVESIEIGLKARWMDDRIQTNVALFHNNVEDMQLSEFLGAYSAIHNAGEANIQGVEIEALFAITDELTATVNYGALDAEYDDFTISGVQLKHEAKFPYMPEEKYSLGLEYNTDLEFAQLRARLDWSHRSSQFAYHELDAALLTEVESYDLLNARVSLIEIDMGGSGQTMEISIWGKNLTDEEYRINGIPIVSDFYAINYYGDPKTTGIDFKVNF